MIGEFRNRQTKVEESETVPERKVEVQKQYVETKNPEQPAIQKIEKSTKQG